MHMEVVKDGSRLMAALRDITPRKPVVIFKTGRTEEGARASASHTGSLASGGNVYHHALKQAGALLVDTWQEYWEVPKVFALQSLPRGNRVAVLTPTGGIGVASVDAAVKAGLTVARFSDATLEKLRELAISRARNPIDLGPTMVMVEDPYSVMKAAMGAALSDPNVDCGIMVLFAGSQGPVADTVEMVRWATQQGRKPVAVWIYGTSASARDETARQVEKLGVPAYVELETAIKALGIAAGYARMKADSGRAAS
jgi:acyl-CoA synthetase (NDP forming)